MVGLLRQEIPFDCAQGEVFLRQDEGGRWRRKMRMVAGTKADTGVCGYEAGNGDV